ncbi:CRISPR-associated endonuclease Cas1 [Persephonella sp.]
MKEVIFITLQGAKIRRKDNQIAVVSGEDVVSSIPINRIESIFLLGNIELTLPAVNFLLSKKVDVYILSLTGKQKGIITNNTFSSNYRQRLKQYKAFIDSEHRLKLAKICVEEKLKKIEKFTGTSMKHMLNSLKTASSISQILGIEGTASNLMFEYFRQNLKNTSGFKNRQYNPPPDPVNGSVHQSV